ncbi:MAG: hypothetical protein HPY52_08750 [Firmicutes bacterium]|nr:hypothetical protein [Bacillota bacterium]
MGKLRVLLTWKPTDVELGVIKEGFPEECEIILPGESKEDMLTAARNCDVIVGGLSRDLLDAASNLKLVHALGHGIDFVLQNNLQAELARRGIPVAKADPAAINISEFVIMAMIALSRRVFKLHEALAYHGDWSHAYRSGRMQGALGGELFNSTLGIISLGAIGKEIARRARTFGMKIMALQRTPKPEDKEEFGLEFLGEMDNMDYVLSSSRYIVLSLPLTHETRGLIGKQAFDKMMQGSYLVNISRGPIVEEEALYDALKSGKLAGAALDVWCAEEEGRTSGYPTKWPIHDYNVIMTPHYSGATRESRIRAIETVGKNLHNLLGGKPLIHLANIQAGY